MFSWILLAGLESRWKRTLHLCFSGFQHPQSLCYVEKEQCTFLSQALKHKVWIFPNILIISKHLNLDFVLFITIIEPILHCLLIWSWITIQYCPWGLSFWFHISLSSPLLFQPLEHSKVERQRQLSETHRGAPLLMRVGVFLAKPVSCHG